jgi:hypothetical protein
MRRTMPEDAEYLRAGLGVDIDDVVAKRLGASDTSVLRARARLSVARAPKWQRDYVAAGLGVLTDAEVGARNSVHASLALPFSKTSSAMRQRFEGKPTQEAYRASTLHRFGDLALVSGGQAGATTRQNLPFRGDEVAHQLNVFVGERQPLVYQHKPLMSAAIVAPSSHDADRHRPSRPCPAARTCPHGFR